MIPLHPAEPVCARPSTGQLAAPVQACRRQTVRLLAMALLATATGLQAAEPEGLTGTWVGVTTAERLIFSPGGSFRTCFAPGSRGNAALGRWKTLSPGHYSLEFTHAAAADCRSGPTALGPFKSTIVGQARLAKGELALFVGGEFPPDVFRPAGRAAPAKP